MRTVYEFSCYTTELKYNRKCGNSLIFYTKEEALRAFKMKATEARNALYDKAISYHECIGQDPHDWEWEGTYYTFNLVTEKIEVDIFLGEIIIYDTIEDTLEHSTIFENLLQEEDHE